LEFQCWERTLVSIWRDGSRDGSRDDAYFCQTLLLSALKRRVHLYVPRLLEASQPGSVGPLRSTEVDASYVYSIVFLNALAKCYSDSAVLARIAHREFVAPRHARHATFLYLWLFGATASQTVVRRSCRRSCRRRISVAAVVVAAPVAAVTSVAAHVRSPSVSFFFSRTFLLLLLLLVTQRAATLWSEATVRVTVPRSASRWTSLTVDWIARYDRRQRPMERDLDRVVDQVLRAQRFSAHSASVTPSPSSPAPTRAIVNLVVDVLWQTLVAHSRAPVSHDDLAGKGRRDCAWVAALLENAVYCTRRIAARRVANLFEVVRRHIEAPVVASPPLSVAGPLERSRLAFKLVADVGCMRAQQGRWRDAIGHLRLACSTAGWSVATRSPVTRFELSARGAASLAADVEEEARVRRVLMVRLADATIHCLDALHAIGAHRAMGRVAEYSRSLPDRLRAAHDFRGDVHEAERVWPVCEFLYRRVRERLEAAEWWAAYRRDGRCPRAEPTRQRPQFLARDNSESPSIANSEFGGCTAVSPLLRSVRAACRRLRLRVPIEP
jgi:hypothetical protein